MSTLMQFMNGLTMGAIYILLASGLTIIFGLQGYVNIAHGVSYMLGAYIGVSLMPRVGFVPTLLLATAAAFVAGLILELVIVRPLVRWRRPGTHLLVATLAVAIVAVEVTKLVWGPVPQLIEIPRILSGPIRIGDFVYPLYWLFVIAVTAALMGLLALLFYKTTLGILVQSIALDSDTSQAMGTNTAKLNTFVFALGSGVAGLAGVLAGPILSVYPSMAFDLLMMLFVIVILGGLGSLWGVVVAGVFVGIVSAFGTAYLTGTAGSIFVFLIMIAALLFRPLGLFGRAGILK